LGSLQGSVLWQESALARRGAPGRGRIFPDFYEKQVDELSQKKQHIIDNPHIAAGCRQKDVERIGSAFTWESIVD
jgi:hypothetical protein